MKQQEVAPSTIKSAILQVAQEGARTKQWISLPVYSLKYGKSLKEKEELAKIVTAHIGDADLLRYDEVAQSIKLRTKSQAVSVLDRQ